MKSVRIFCIITALLTSAAVAQATSCGTHKKSDPGKAPPHKAGHDHDQHPHHKDQPGDEDHASDEEESELHEQMEVLGKNFKKLGRLFRSDNPDAAEALKYTAVCKKAATAVKDLVPEIVEEMAEGKEKEEAREQYQGQIKKLMKTFTDLEAALKENDTAKAKAIVDLLKKQKKQGHDKFIEEDE